MPAPVSKKQMRYMMAILHGKGGTSSRGDRVPKSVAGKYAGHKDGKSLPESKGKEAEGGKWGESHHAKDKKKVDSKRLERKKKKAKLRKALEEYVLSKGYRGAGALVVNGDGALLLGRRTDNGMWSTPGGHVEADESFAEAALRELREEAGIVGRDPVEILHGKYNGYESKTFLIKGFKGKAKNSSEMSNLKWFHVSDIPWDKLTNYTSDAINNLLKDKLTKVNSIEQMLIQESLQKNIIRSGNAPSNTVYELTHGDALKVVGNGTFRMLRDATKDMSDEDFRDISMDHYTLHIRKHTNDVYSGRIIDGHKQIHQFTNKSLPSVAAELMSIFEWYLPEDEGELELLDEDNMSDDSIEGGLNSLIENYRKHNIVNIYSEMENIREEIRHGNAVDLQQVEQKMMKLFDKLEDTILDIIDKHNDFTEDAGNSVDELEAKLKELQIKIDEMGKKPVTVDAYSSAPANDKKVHEQFYPYLPRPEVSISPDGHVRIAFGSGWQPMERENFLKDMKAKIIRHKEK